MINLTQDQPHPAAECASIAGLLLSTGSVVVEKPEKEKTPAMPDGGMGDMC